MHICCLCRPYHALLLLDSEKALLAQLPLDCSPALVRLIKICSAMKNLQQLAQDADLALLQVTQHICTRYSNSIFLKKVVTSFHKYTFVIFFGSLGICVAVTSDVFYTCTVYVLCI